MHEVMMHTKSGRGKRVNRINPSDLTRTTNNLNRSVENDKLRASVSPKISNKILTKTILTTNNMRHSVDSYLPISNKRQRQP